MALADIRREYARRTLSEHEVDPDPVRQLQRWLADAERAKLTEATAMTLATATPGGAPSARMVLLKGLDARGLVFFTDYRSQKGAELARNPHAALVFYWADLERQVRVTGVVERTSHEESAAYFATRPVASRVAASASHQSAVLASRDALEARVAELAARFDAASPPPLPPHWGGFRVAPEAVEFWQGRPNRLHDRLLYTRAQPGAPWRIERLSP
jgi:pyridoxamine 5'-phosphate oxidase